MTAPLQRPFGDWSAFVGHDGGLLAIYNVASAVSGKAEGFKISPTRTPNTQSLDLTDLSNQQFLSGPNSKILVSNGDPVSSSDGNFVFKLDQNEFDEAQLYYFLQFCKDSAQQIAGKNLGSRLRQSIFAPMHGTVHIPQANAFYFPQEGQLYFGDYSSGGNTIYSSRSLDIVLHEFGHAISDGICKLGRAKENRPAL